VSPLFVRVSKIPIISTGSISLAKEVSRRVDAGCCAKRYAVDESFYLRE
jgi:hypothetical protein